MNDLFQSAEAAVTAGQQLSIELLGGEGAIYLHAATLARSMLFGDAAEALAREWADLRDPSEAERFVAMGLREQTNRIVLGHAVDALSQAGFHDFRFVVMALDQHARNAGADDFVRTEAAAGIVRIALRENRWRPTATALLVALEELRDESALAEVARLAAVTWEQFRDDEMIALLERHAGNAQAAYERGVIGVALALESDSFDTVPDRMRQAQRWLRRSTEHDEDRRDAKMYLLIAEALEAIASAHSAPPELCDALRVEAVARYRWDEPRAGADWLLPPHEAELQWIPVIDQIVSLSGRLTQPSWLEASTVLGDTVKAYLAVRSIRPGLPGVELVLRPAIEAAFVRERGLLAHLENWIDRSDGVDFAPSDLERLRGNIAARRANTEGKAPGTTSNGRPPSQIF